MAVEARRRMDLRADLWSDLPTELVEFVLSFVPVRDLCRYRTVSKSWDDLIRSPGFGTLCEENGKGQAPFMVMHYARRNTGKPVSESQGWCILDLHTKQSYLVKHSEAHEISPIYKRLDRMVAMDGGLIACKYKLVSLKAKSPAAIVVYNLLGKTLKELPAAPEHSTPGTPLLNLVVDNIGKSFKIFLMSVHTKAGLARYPYTTPEERSKILSVPFLRCYNSATNEWLGLANPSCFFEYDGFENRIVPMSSVFCQDLLYVVFKTPPRHLHIEEELWRYNPLEDSWDKLLVLDPSRMTNPSCDLVVSANRLFLVGWVVTHHPDPGDMEFEVSEFKIHDMTLEKLFVWPRAQAAALFDWGTHGFESCPMSVTGFGQSLMFVSGTTKGNMISFDVVTRTLDRSWPRNPLERLSKGFCSWTGKEMNFVLPGLLG